MIRINSPTDYDDLFVHRVIVRWEFTMEDAQEWCNDPSRPGVYQATMRFIADIKEFQEEFILCPTFHFIDYDTAIEFKLRWG